MEWEKREPADEEKWIFTAEELTSAAPPEPKYLVESLLTESGLAALVGMPDIGKSQLARQLCIAIALGMSEFLGFKLRPRHQAALYVSTEDSETALMYQLGKQLSGLGMNPKGKLRFIPAEAMDPKEIVEKIHRALTAAPADLVVVDSFGDVFVGTDSNSNAAMRNSLRPFARLAKVHDCLILFIHHVNKASYRQAPGQEHIQGGSGLAQKIRTALFLSDGEGNRRYLSTVKGNYTPKKMKENSIILELNESTLLFQNTGSFKPTSSLGADASGKSEYDYSTLESVARDIFGSGETTYGNFIREYCAIYGKSIPTAKRIHSSLKDLEIIEKTSTGAYRIKTSAKPT